VLNSYFFLVIFNAFHFRLQGNIASHPLHSKVAQNGPRAEDKWLSVACQARIHVVKEHNVLFSYTGFIVPEGPIETPFFHLALRWIL